MDETPSPRKDERSRPAWWSQPIRAGLPQPLQWAAALVGLAASTPLMAACAVGVLLSSPGPVLFRQTRVGRGGRQFELLKFRTMRADGQGLGVTARGDTRITPFGRVLRKTKLDELPQLWNVLRGEMALVGPRPEIPRYVQLDDPLLQAVLQARPGLTDPLAIHLRNEEELMAQTPEGDREGFYLRVIQPYKLMGHLAYLQRRSASSDVVAVLRTVLVVVAPGLAKPPSLDTIRSVVQRQASPV